MDRYLTVDEAKSQLLPTIDRLRGSDRIVITKRGRPRVVVVDFEQYALLEDAAWLLNDPAHRAAMKRAREEWRAGAAVSLPNGAQPTVGELRKLLQKRRRRPRG